MVNEPTVDLARVEGEARRMADGESEINLSDFKHGRARHADLVTWSALAWWLLSYGGDTTDWSLVLPDRGSASLRHLARTGIIAAAESRSIVLRYSDGQRFGYSDLFSSPDRNRFQLQGNQWQSFDELDGDELRVIPDLASPWHLIPTPSWSGLIYPWLGCLNLRSPALSVTGYRKFLGAADKVVSELIKNVPMWSRANRAFAAVSVTKGGGERGDGRRASWNRLHVVVADNGIGIPSALRHYLAAYHDSESDFGCLNDIDILCKLIFSGRNGRELSHHDGDGIYKSQLSAGKWVGALDIITTNTRGEILRVGTRGIDKESLEKAPSTPAIPGAQGTLMHVLLQATDYEGARQEAASYESLRFETNGYKETTDRLYQPILASA